jgi:hypothetical protein
VVRFGKAFNESDGKWKWQAMPLLCEGPDRETGFGWIFREWNRHGNNGRERHSPRYTIQG